MGNVANNLRLWLCIGLLAAGCLVQPAAFGQEPANPDGQKVTAEDMQRMSRQFQEAQKKEQETLRQAREEAERRERERIAADKTAVYTLDPDLKKASDYFFDQQNRRREVAIELFEKYLEKNPDTIFKPEIYAHIGQLYSSHRRADLGETYRPDLMVKYYRLALNAYGPKYSTAKRSAWASIVNQPDKTLEDRQEYYDWLRAFNEKLTADEMHPLVSMDILAQGHRKSEYWSEEERDHAAKALKRDLPEILSVAERNIFYRSKIEELPRIIKLYPGTELARQAQRRLHGDDKRVLATLDESLKAANKPDSQQSSSATDVAPNPPEEASAPQPVAEDVAPSLAYGMMATARQRWASWCIVAAAIAVFTLAAVLWRRRASA